MYGQIESGSFRWKTTVYGPLTVVLFRFERSVQMPWSPLIFSTRSNDHLTSAEVIGVPSENLTLWRSPHVHVFRFAEALQPVASTGCSFAPCGKPYRPWKSGRSSVNES